MVVPARDAVERGQRLLLERGHVVIGLGERFLLPGENLGGIFLRGLIELALRAARLGHRPALHQLAPRACSCPRPASSSCWPRRRRRARRSPAGTASGVAALALRPGVAAASGCRGRSPPFAGAGPAARVVDGAVVALDLLGLALDRRIELIAGVERFAVRLGFHQRVFVGRPLLADDLADALAELDDLRTRLGLLVELRDQIGLAPWPLLPRRAGRPPDAHRRPGSRPPEAPPWRKRLRPRAVGRRQSASWSRETARSAAPACAASRLRRRAPGPPAASSPGPPSPPAAFASLPSPFAASAFGAAASAPGAVVGAASAVAAASGASAAPSLSGPPAEAAPPGIGAATGATIGATTGATPAAAPGGSTTATAFAEAIAAPGRAGVAGFGTRVKAGTGAATFGATTADGAGAGRGRDGGST